MRYPAISVDLFRKNRRKLLSLMLPDSSAIICSSDEMPRNGDQFYKYRQSSDMFYLAGIEQERTILVLNPSHPDQNRREVLFILKVNREQEIWYGKKLTEEEASEISGIESIYFLEDYDQLLPGIVGHCHNIYFNEPLHFKVKPEVISADERMAKKVKKFFPMHSCHQLAPLLWKTRMLKEDEEISLIRQACRITRDAYLRVLRFLRPGVMEYEVEAEIIHEFIKQGAAGHAYDPIIASGKNACTLHYTVNDKCCYEGDMLLMDFGVEYANYAADLSRTIPVSGVFTKRQAELYDATLRVLRYARSVMKPGITIPEYHNQVGEFWKEEHIRLGLYSRQEAEQHTGAPAIWHRYYMHGTSHSIGLDVHDMFDKSETLRPGMLLSCEPGIYIPEENIGIRLEDNILITEDGNMNLMENFPVEREEIIEIMKNR
jgi:Xaa-Pro aminopeptidase